MDMYIEWVAGIKPDTATIAWDIISLIPDAVEATESYEVSIDASEGEDDGGGKKSSSASETHGVLWYSCTGQCASLGTVFKEIKMYGNIAATHKISDFDF